MDKEGYHPIQFQTIAGLYSNQDVYHIVLAAPIVNNGWTEGEMILSQANGDIMQGGLANIYHSKNDDPTNPNKRK